MGWRWIHLSGVIALALGGCQSPTQNAPAISPAMTQRFDAGDLASGRRLFLTRCIDCHALPDTRRFDSARMDSILGTMAARADLTPPQQVQVRAYLHAVRTES
jgi:hypothetical protein